MATSDDIFRIEPITHELSRLLFSHVQQQLPADTVWVRALLDVRFEECGGFIMKLRVARTMGEALSLNVPTNISLQLIQLEGARPTGQDRWYGCKLEVTAAGACEVNFDYDPACSNDPHFFRS